MARLPVPGSDEGQWGQVLNDFLLQTHDVDGTLKADAVASSSLQDNSVSGAKLQDGSVTNAKLSLSGGSDGQVLTRDSLAANGSSWTTPAGGQVYPLEEGYGFHSASASPDVGAGTSWFSGWQVRVWVPAHKPITKATIFVSVAATGTASLAGFGVYSDDGQTLLGEAVDSGAFLSTGLPEVALASPVAAQTSGRFVRVLVTANYSGTPPECVFMIEGGPIGGVVLNSVAIRSAYFAALTSLPSSFNSSTGAGLSGWSPSNYLPIILLG